jgi:hypothetical protein
MVFIDLTKVRCDGRLIWPLGAQIIMLMQGKTGCFDRFWGVASGYSDRPRKTFLHFQGNLFPKMAPKYRLAFLAGRNSSRQAFSAYTRPLRATDLIVAKGATSHKSTTNNTHTNKHAR